MNNYPQEMHRVVYNILSNNEIARNSDIELYKLVLRRFYGTTDISQINVKGDIFSTIKRTRQKIQSENPFLGPNKNVKEYRKEMEKKYVDYARYW